MTAMTERLGESLTDEQARALAIDPAVSCVVEAPAGSGKTSLLIARILNLLPTVDEPEHILAITFTTKAAQEMRHRVLEALNEAANATAVENDYHASVRALALKVLEHDRRRGWNLLHHPSRLMIKTIDGFCRQLVAQIPLAAKSAALNVVDDASKVYDQAALAVLERLRREPNLDPSTLELMRLIRNRANTFRELSELMLGKRSQWYNRYRPEDPSALFASLCESLLTLQEYGLARLKTHVPLRLINAVLEIQRSRAPSTERPSWQEPLEFTVEQLPRWHQFVALLLSQNGGFRRAFTTKQGYHNERDVVAAMKACLEEFVEANEASKGALLSALNTLAIIPAGVYPPDSLTNLIPILKTLNLTVEALQQLFIREGRVDFEHISMAAVAALGSEDRPEELLLRLDVKLKHLLVDEFQDTSQSQWQLLNLLVSGFEPGDGRSVFLVGDPMQSIYGFREAQVGLFLSVAKYPMGAVHFQSLQLRKNFRSQQRLVEWFNRHFETILAQPDDEVVGRVQYRQALSQRPALEGPAVETAWFHQPNQQAEWAYATAEIVKHLAHPQRLKIAVLASTRDSLRGVALALTKLNIEFEGVNLVPLSERALIGDCLALTRSIVAPGDEVAGMALLRAPWCGLTLAELEHVVSTRPALMPLMEWCESPQLQGLHPQLFVRVQPVASVIHAARRELGSSSLSVSVERAFEALWGPHTLDDVGDLADAHAFFQALHQWQEAGRISLEDFERGLAKLYSQVKPANPQVQLMTIHAAKGLEWDVVIVVGLGKKPPNEQSQWLVWQSLVNARGERHSLLAPLEGRGSQSPVLNSIKKFTHQRLRAERERLWYVACTRAKRTLVLLGTTNPKGPHSDQIRPTDEIAPASNTGLGLLWDALETCFRANINPTPSASVVANRLAGVSPGHIARVKQPLVPKSLLPDATHQIHSRVHSRPSVFDFEWVSPTARCVGIVIHEIFERVGRGDLGLADLAELNPTHYQHRLSELGVFDANLVQAVTRVQAVLERVARDALAQWIFSMDHTEVHNEWELIRATDVDIQTLRIDRSFVDERGVRWIIDFKTSSHEGRDLEGFLASECERYGPQLSRYASWVQAIEPARVITTALYFPVLGRLVEVSPGAGPRSA